MFKPHQYKWTQKAPGRSRTYRYGRKKKPGLTQAQRNAVNLMIKQQGEPKHLDTNTTIATDVSNTGNFQQLSTVTQGDGETQRLNDRIVQTSIQYKGWIFKGASAVGGTLYRARVILFRWRPDTGDDAPTAIADILEDSNVISHYVQDDVKRRKFQVLYDNMVHLDPGTAASAFDYGPGPFLLNMDKTCGLKTKKMNFGPASTDGTNHIYRFMLSNTATANAVEIEEFIRFNYKDSL